MTPASPLDLVEKAYDLCRDIRRPHEIQWFINSAFRRGLHQLEWNPAANRLVSLESSVPGKTRVTINRILPKATARHAKMTKNPPRAEVIPATTEVEDKRNARMSQKFLAYAWRAFELEEAYSDALLIAQEQGRGWWWIYWDPNKLATVRQVNPQTGKAQAIKAPVGDIVIEPGTSWEIFAPDPSQPKLSKQPYIIRARKRKVSWVKAIHKVDVPPEVSFDEVSNYENMIAGLNARSTAGVSSDQTHRAPQDSVIVKEYFEAPTADYPQGRYVVIANGHVLKDQPELPYGFGDMSNPYPCEAFIDVLTAGQFWGTTYIEQLIGVQKEYNALRITIRQHLKLLGKGKLMIPSQANIPENAWSSEPEKITYDYIPGMPQPFVWTPANIASDAWRLVDLLRDEIDVVSQIHPNSEGLAANTNSGFQVNLLQEASDSAHAPVIRQHERAVAGMYKKIRRLVKLGYAVPRMLTVVGKTYQAEVLEFSRDNFDENADIVIRAGSAMPDFKAARVQSVRDLYQSGMLGPVGDENTNRKAMGMLEMGEIEEIQEEASRDVEAAKQENATFAETGQIAQPQYYENHLDHHATHDDLLKSPDSKLWPPEMRMKLIWHDILTMRYLNYQTALAIANEYGLAGQVPPPPGPPPVAPPPGVPGAPGAGPVQPPPGQAPQGAPAQPGPPPQGVPQR